MLKPTFEKNILHFFIIRIIPDQYNVRLDHGFACLALRVGQLYKLYNTSFME